MNKKQETNITLDSQALCRLADFLFKEQFDIAALKVADAKLEPLPTIEQTVASNYLLHLLKRYGADEIEASLTQDSLQQSFYLVQIEATTPQGSKVSINRYGTITSDSDNGIEELKNALLKANKVLKLS